MEGSFGRSGKTERHPHTNMAKAALNMLTRTVAHDYRGVGIHMNSVDTGWVTDERPHADKRVCQLASEAAYDQLVSCGVRVWNFQPAMLHAKIMTIDERVALVGTANFDSRSIALNEQVALVVHDPAFTATLDEHFDNDLTLSTRIDRERWANRPVRQRAREQLAHWVSYGIRGGGAAR